jgi:osmotically-inducible protein OsmY
MRPSLTEVRSASPAEHRCGGRHESWDVRQDVIRQLQWYPQVSYPDAISVAVQDGAVTLCGHAPTYAEKLATVRAAERVYGVRAVPAEIKVRLADSQGRL